MLLGVFFSYSNIGSGRAVRMQDSALQLSARGEGREEDFAGLRMLQKLDENMEHLNTLINAVDSNQTPSRETEGDVTPASKESGEIVALKAEIAKIAQEATKREAMQADLTTMKASQSQGVGQLQEFGKKNESLTAQMEALVQQNQELQTRLAQQEAVSVSKDAKIAEITLSNQEMKRGMERMLVSQREFVDSAAQVNARLERQILSQIEVGRAPDRESVEQVMQSSPSPSATQQLQPRSVAGNFDLMRGPAVPSLEDIRFSQMQQNLAKRGIVFDQNGFNNNAQTTEAQSSANQVLVDTAASMNQQESGLFKKFLTWISKQLGISNEQEKEQFVNKVEGQVSNISQGQERGVEPEGRSQAPLTLPIQPTNMPERANETQQRVAPMRNAETAMMLREGQVKMDGEGGRGAPPPRQQQTPLTTEVHSNRTTKNLSPAVVAKTQRSSTLSNSPTKLEGMNINNDRGYPTPEVIKKEGEVSMRQMNDILEGIKKGEITKLDEKNQATIYSAGGATGKVQIPIKLNIDFAQLTANTKYDERENLIKFINNNPQCVESLKLDEHVLSNLGSSKFTIGGTALKLDRLPSQAEVKFEVQPGFNLGKNSAAQEKIADFIVQRQTIGQYKDLNFSSEYLENFLTDQKHINKVVEKCKSIQIGKNSMSLEETAVIGSKPMIYDKRLSAALNYNREVKGLDELKKEFKPNSLDLEAIKRYEEWRDHAKFLREITVGGLKDLSKPVSNIDKAIASRIENASHQNDFLNFNQIPGYDGNFKTVDVRVNVKFNGCEQDSGISAYTPKRDNIIDFVNSSKGANQVTSITLDECAVNNNLGDKIGNKLANKTIDLEKLLKSGKKVEVEADVQANKSVQEKIANCLAKSRNNKTLDCTGNNLASVITTEQAAKIAVKGCTKVMIDRINPTVEKEAQHDRYDTEKRIFDPILSEALKAGAIIDMTKVELKTSEQIKVCAEFLARAGNDKKLDKIQGFEKLMETPEMKEAVSKAARQDVAEKLGAYKEDMNRMHGNCQDMQNKNSVLATRLGREYRAEHEQRQNGENNQIPSLPNASVIPPIDIALIGQRAESDLPSNSSRSEIIDTTLPISLSKEEKDQLTTIAVVLKENSVNSENTKQGSFSSKISPRNIAAQQQNQKGTSTGIGG